MGPWLSAPGPGSPRPHLHRDWVSLCLLLDTDVMCAYGASVCAALTQTQVDALMADVQTGAEWSGAWDYTSKILSCLSYVENSPAARSPPVQRSAGPLARAHRLRRHARARSGASRRGTSEESEALSLLQGTTKFAIPSKTSRCRRKYVYIYICIYIYIYIYIYI